MEYEIVERDSEIVLSLNGFGIAKVYCRTQNCLTPLTKDDAREVVKMIKKMLEETYPASDIDESEYNESREFMDELTDSMSSDLMKMMLLKKLME